MFKERKQIAICIMAALMVGGFVLFDYMPLQKKIKTLKQIKNVQAITIAKGAANRKQIPIVEEQLLTLQKELGNFQVNIPQQRALGTFVQQIADLMNQHNLKDQQITPGEETQADGLFCIPVRMQCKGTLMQLFKFYQQLQNLDRHIRIELVKLRNDNEFSGNVDMEMDVVIYYKADVA